MGQAGVSSSPLPHRPEQLLGGDRVSGSPAHPGQEVACLHWTWLALQAQDILSYPKAQTLLHMTHGLVEGSPRYPGGQMRTHTPLRSLFVLVEGAFESCRQPAPTRPREEPAQHHGLWWRLLALFPAVCELRGEASKPLYPIVARSPRLAGAMEPICRWSCERRRKVHSWLLCVFSGPGHRPKAGCMRGPLFPVPGDLRVGTRPECWAPQRGADDIGLPSQVEAPSTSLWSPCHCPLL